MKPITVLQKHGLNMKSSVHGVYDMGANYAIALNKDALIRKRGFHLNEEDLLNIFHNLPIELKQEIKKVMRFVQNQEEIEWYNAIKVEPKIEEVKVEEVETEKPKKKKVVEPREKFDAEKENEILESFVEGTETTDTSILDENYSDCSQEQLVDYRKRLKDFAKELGIKIPPATKNIEKIKARIFAELEE
jgi:hypothetical protein